jgi:purine nucleosidase
MDFYGQLLGEHACAMHSPLAVAIAAHPELITAQLRVPMSVELAGTYTRGMTVADRRRGQDSQARQWMTAPLVNYPTDVDRDRFLRLFMTRVRGE